MDTSSAILMILFFWIIVIISSKLLVGSTKKRVQGKIDLIEYERDKEARKTLDRLKENKNIYGVIDYLQHPLLRSDAVYFLGEFKDPCAIEPLIELFKVNNLGDIERKTILRALIKIGNLSLKPMVSVLADIHLSSSVRKELAKALGELRNSNAVEPLITILKDENRRVRASAAKALKKITGQNFGEDTIKWQEWWDKNKEVDNQSVQ